MVHPVQSVIESLYSAGRCPRLHVNASHEDVVCPDFIREQWKERLIIDLDASYPLDLTFGEDGLSADLSFGGYVTRCEFPWEAVYIVADRATGRGIVLDRNMPESVRALFQKSRAESAKAKSPELRPVSGDDDIAEGGDDERVDTTVIEAIPTGPTPEAKAPPTTKPKPKTKPKTESPAGVAAKADPPVTKPAETMSEAPSTDEKQVQRRRAAFRVIDGGGA
jgi:stringent starvation protein B